MATKSSEKDLTCPRCCKIYVDPRKLSCNHSFCLECLEEYWKKKKSHKCPSCKKRCSKTLPPPNLQLKILCDDFHQEKSKPPEPSHTMCSLHNEKFKLFCLQDKQPVCVVCRDSKTHSNHNFRPVDEAAADHRAELQLKLSPLQEKLNKFLNAKSTCDQTAQHIKRQAENTEKLIEEEFLKLKMFLLQEEEKSLTALRTEVKIKSKIVEHTTKNINKGILQLSATILSIHDELAAEDTIFLKNYNATVAKTECTMEDPQTLSGSLIDTATHLGNLKFSVWTQMKDIIEYSPVILDSNTAHPRLTISDDLTSVVCKDEGQELPENLERNDHYMWTLGFTGFRSGIHCWDVDVNNSEQWSLGIVTGSMRKEKKYFTAGIWRCPYENITYGASSTGGPTITLNVDDKLQRVRVKLDCDKGQVSFFDPIKRHQLHTFSHTFADTVYAYLSNQSKRHPLKILPKNISIVTAEMYESMREQSWMEAHIYDTPESSPPRLRPVRNLQQNRRPRNRGHQSIELSFKITDSNV